MTSDLETNPDVRAKPNRYVPLPPMLELSLRESPIVSRVIDDWSEIALPDCWIVAGAVFQSFWNREFGLSAVHGINDVDLVYFDSADLTDETENDHCLRINAFFDDLGVRIDVKNEARVHLWYENAFGYPINAYHSVESAMETFPTTAGAIGIRPKGQALEAFAPFGFEDLMNLVIRPNKVQITRDIYEKKIARWQPNWPRVRFLGWNDV